MIPAGTPAAGRGAGHPLSSPGVPPATTTVDAATSNAGGTAGHAQSGPPAPGTYIGCYRNTAGLGPAAILVIHHLGEDRIVYRSRDDGYDQTLTDLYYECLKDPAAAELVWRMHGRPNLENLP